MSNSPKCKKGDFVQWIGGSYQNLKGIVVETRDCNPSAFEQQRTEVKVIWDKKGLGSLAQAPGGSWQRVACLKVLSSMEQNDENR